MISNEIKDLELGGRDLFKMLIPTLARSRVSFNRLMGFLHRRLRPPDTGFIWSTAKYLVKRQKLQPG